MDMERIELSGFTSKESGCCGRPTRRWGNERPRSARRSHGRHGGGGVVASSMLVKLGVCALAAAAVLIVKLQGVAPEAAPVSAQAEAGATEAEFDDMLGKLRFVELPGLLEVFASSDKLPLPLEYSSYSIAEDSLILTLRISADEQIAVPVSGEIKIVENDAALGEYAAIAADGDMELRFYGLSNIAVEEGQALRAGDSLGTVYAGDSLHVAVSINGRPSHPSDIFELRDEDAV